MHARMCGIHPLVKCGIHTDTLVCQVWKLSRQPENPCHKHAADMSVKTSGVLGHTPTFWQEILTKALPKLEKKSSVAGYILKVLCICHYLALRDSPIVKKR